MSIESYVCTFWLLATLRHHQRGYPILDELIKTDRFMVLSDFWSYVQCQRKVSKAFTRKDQWDKVALRNIARCGKFSSDRTIMQYAEEIWDVDSVKVKL